MLQTPLQRDSKPTSGPSSRQVIQHLDAADFGVRQIFGNNGGAKGPMAQFNACGFSARADVSRIANLKVDKQAPHPQPPHIDTVVDHDNPHLSTHSRSRATSLYTA